MSVEENFGSYFDRPSAGIGAYGSIHGKPTNWNTGVRAGKVYEEISPGSIILSGPNKGKSLVERPGGIGVGSPSKAFKKLLDRENEISRKVENRSGSYGQGSP